MPDCHIGYGMPIGGVLATKDVIIPNAVGVDIGCGVIAVKLPINRETNPEFGELELKRIMAGIRELVPVGYKKHSKPRRSNDMPDMDVGCDSRDYPVVIDEYKNAAKSLGTLGGGNHFIEIQCDEETNIWVMIHSGSRNLGKKVADHHNKIAKELNSKYYSEVPEKWELAFLPIYSDEAVTYMREMEFCVNFAQDSRRKMMDAVLEVMDHEIVGGIGIDWIGKDYLDVAHNYAVMEHHYGKNVMVHRKGATRARAGCRGIIPASQGAPSHIVMGKGNHLSFESCSHGAGRLMGRNQAKKKLNLEHEKKILDDQGIIHSIRGVSNLDEAPSAYKDIGIVMKNQEDLVESIHTLQPLAVIKG
jgi:tRNA-splicing ligase RtcB